MLPAHGPSSVKALVPMALAGQHFSSSACSLAFRCIPLTRAFPRHRVAGRILNKI